MNGTDDTITEGRAAWQRIRDHGRKSFDDWITVARALAIGRTAALTAAKTNKAVGSKYNLAMGRFLVDHQLDDVTASERYRALQVLEHLDAISTFRAGLDEAKRRTYNSPSATWHAWRRSLKPATPARPYVHGRKSSHRHGRPIYFSQDAIRRGAMAIRESGSNDIFRLARACLEAALPNADAIAALLDPPPAQRPAEAPAAAMVQPAA